MLALQRLIVLGLVLSLQNVNAQDAQEPLLGGVGGVDECHNACTALVATLGEATAFYKILPEGFKESYYSTRQREVTPACVIQPSSTQDVSTVIKVINQHSCHFAIKSGGHAMFAGGSNAAGGITIDLKHLNGIDLSDDESTVSVGPGIRWGTVYEKLEPKGLTVVGGRVSEVGVGGFLLGGGISFLSRLHGWASDNVKNYEVVLANGSISNVNYQSHPDLFWALRGGGPNFGVVTNFELETYRQGPVWGGSAFNAFSDIVERRSRYKHLDVQHPPIFSLLTLTKTLGRLGNKLICLIGMCTTTDKFIDTFVTMATKGEADLPYMHLYMSFAYMPPIDLLAGSSCMVHFEPIANPPAFADFESLKSVQDGRKVRNLTDLMREIDYWSNPGRWMYTPMTIVPNKELISKILDLFIETIEPIKDIPGIFPSFVMQPITQIARANRNKNGGNAFGIKEEDGPIIMLSISPKWDRAEDDAIIQESFTKFMDRSVALAKDMGLHHPWIYQNYANISQDVFGGYGEENRQRLRDIQGKYDPDRMFAKLQPGYFKL